MPKHLDIPLNIQDVADLRAGEAVTLSGVIVTARDAAHKYMVDSFVKGHCITADEETYLALRRALQQGAIYHCGPVVEKTDDGQWRIVAAGPTTSMREEKYEAQVMEHFGVRAVIGKGGMGDGTLAACRRLKAVYLHAVGGAAASISGHIKAVLGVYKLEFGLPEAMWLLRVEKLPLVVTMDAHGVSLHESLARGSADRLQVLMGGD